DYYCQSYDNDLSVLF
nr:immunoglobulin light chain junction region [Macaca mulatta]MOX69134.1 immunoglobulin light chain junction region [Macaca mulatta]MOX69153.1 immunoglobulin light chain junction region [Macaca mulatta]MOX69178.1 immunoglobulin light chain junction region [Macaca mulatta]MOX69222.1 immunoglobulin light chain junction region [Macaca mulatta]